MGILTIIFLAIALAMDCFAVSIANGIALKQFHWIPILKMAILFGLFQAIMPVFGWLAGLGFRSLIEDWDHWIALAILSVLGIKMIIESFDKKEHKDINPSLSWGKLLLLAIATSIDALATGLVFLTEEISVFFMAVLFIGIFSFSFSLLGNLIGIYAGRKLPVNMEMIGGVVLIFIGIKIFIEHTGFLNF